MLGSLFLITLSGAGIFVLLIPAILIDLAAGERALPLEMTFMAALGISFGVMLMAAIAGRIKGVDRELNFLSLVLIWFCTPLVGALGLMVLCDLGFVSAWLEAVSALTTTGATVLKRDVLTTGVLFWRASLEWYGGFLTLVSIIHVLAPAGFGGLRTSGRRRGTAGRADGHWGALSGYASIFWQYGAATAVIALGLLFAGVTPSEAVMLAMIGIATGGFLPFEGPLEAHIGSAATLVLALGLCFGTLNVFWRRNVLRHPKRMFQSNDEVRIVAAVIALLTVVYTARIADSAGTAWFDLAPVLLEGFFTATSLVATSGIETRPGVIALLPALLVMMIVMVGACVYSTTGGIKYYRLATMAIFARVELNRLIYPRGITPSRFSGQAIPEESIRATWAYFVLVILSIAVGAVLITSSAANFEGGMALAVSFFASAGPVYDALRPATEGLPGVASGWPSFAELPATAVIPAVLLMTIGRLEVLIVFAVVNISYWRKR